MTATELIESCEIFAKYDEKGKDCWVIQGADHDVIYGPSFGKIFYNPYTYEKIYLTWENEYGEQSEGDPNMSLEDNKRLEELGWHKSYDNDFWEYCA